MSAFTYSIAQLIHTVLNAYIWIIIISALLSFIRPDPYNQFVQAIYKLTEPLYAFVRKQMPFLVVSGMDLTPLILILGLQFVDTLMMRSLVG